MLSSNDLADRLGVSRATVIRAVAKGLLRPALVTPGGHRRFVAPDADGLGGASANHNLGGEIVGSGEAARLLGVSQQTLNRAARKGKVRAATVTPGGHRRFATSEIAESRREAANGAGRAPGAAHRMAD